MDVHLFVRAAALLACALAAGCGSLARGPAPADEPAFVVLGPDGEARARLVTRERGCPEIRLDGRAVPMAVRVPYGAIPPRPG